MEFHQLILPSHRLKRKLNDNSKNKKFYIFPLTTLSLDQICHISGLQDMGKKIFKSYAPINQSTHSIFVPLRIY